MTINLRCKSNNFYSALSQSLEYLTSISFIYSLNSSATGMMEHKVNLSSIACLNSVSFSYTSCLTRLKNPISSPIYPLLDDRFMPSPRTLVWTETRTVSSRIWIWVPNDFYCIKSASITDGKNLENISCY